MSNKPFLKNLFPLSLQSKIVLYFGLMFIIVITLIEVVKFYGVPFTNFEGEYRALKSEALGKLNLVADLKKERLQRWIEERNDGMDVIAQSTLVKNSIKQLKQIIQKNVEQGRKGDQLWQAVKKEQIYIDLRNHLRLIKSTYGVYNEIEIIDRDTKLTIATTYNPDLGKKIQEADVYANITNIDDIYIALHKDPHSQEGKFVLIIARLVNIFDPVDNSKIISAILMAYIDPKDFIEPLLHTGDGLGQTGEALLVDKNRNILVPLKHPLSDGKRAMPLEYQITAKPATFAARGEEGIVISKDYRNVPVLAAFRHICFTPELRWGLVVKRDLTEVFALLHHSRSYTIAVGVIGILSALLFIGLVAGKVTSPIKNMTDIAHRVENDDFTARAKITSSDELGFLAESFNSMIDRVENWKKQLEQQVYIRTVELTEEIDHRKLAEEKLERTYKKLKEQSALLAQTEKMSAVGTLVAGTAHELNNPIMGILNFAEYCMKHTSTEDKLYTVMQDIENEAKRCAEIVRNLLTFSHVEQDDDNVYQKEGLATIVERVLKLLSYRIEKQRIEVVMHIADDTPDIYMNSNAIQQLILNLTGNAFDAMENSDKKQFGVDICRKGKFVQITISDTGCGIATESLNSIFDPFFTTKAVGQGTGLGLSVSQGIVKMHEGDIICKSEEGEGTKFTILLPIEKRGQKNE